MTGWRILYTFVAISNWYMKRLAIIIAGMLASLLVASAQNYVRAGDGNYGKVLYNWDGTFLRSGESKYSTPLLNFEGQKIRMGESKYATAKWFWDGTVLHSGENKYGRGIVWSDGIDIRAGENKYGTLLFYRDGTRIKTEGKYGKVVFTVEGSIPLPILIWISVID